MGAASASSKAFTASLLHPEASITHKIGCVVEMVQEQKNSSAGCQPVMSHKEATAPSRPAYTNRAPPNGPWRGPNRHNRVSPPVTGTAGATAMLSRFDALVPAI